MEKGRKEQISRQRVMTYFSFVLCIAEPFSSAWEQTEAFLCYLSDDQQIGNYGMSVCNKVQPKKTDTITNTEY